MISFCARQNTDEITFTKDFNIAVAFVSLLSSLIFLQKEPLEIFCL